MADGFIIVPPDSTGKKMDTTELVVGANTVERERVNIADGVAAAQIATVTAANALKVDGSAVTQPVSGTVTSNQGGAPWTARVQDGVGATLATVTAANAVKVDGSAVTQPVSGTVTANIGTSGALALDASVAGLSLAQGAATAGQKAVLAEAAVTTAAPAYTTGNSNPLSLTTAGLLRVDGSGVTQPVSGTVTSNQGGAPWSQRIQDGVGATLATVTAANAIKVDGSAVTQPVSGTVTANAGTGLADLTSTGTITALNGSVTLAIAGARGAGYLLTGVWVATVQAQISLDGGTTFIAIDSYDYATEKVVISTTANSTFAIADMRGASHVRVTATAFTSGTINVTIKASQAADIQNTKFDGVPASAVPNHAAMVGASDGTNLLTLRASTAAPAGAEAGLIVRNVPSGTQTVAGTVTANQGTANATPWNENIAQIAGVVTLTGNGVTGAGSQRVTIASDNTAFSVNNTPPANQSMNLAQVAGTATVTGGVAGLLATAGAAASGAAKSGNPVQIGGVFNTVQPTVTTGQAVELQATARGAEIVATGVDVFNVTVNTALPTGANVIGALSANQSVNVAQIAGAATSTAAAGTQKVGIVGNAAAAMDAAQNAAAPANELVIGGVYNTTIPALTAGNASQLQVDSAGSLLVCLGGRSATYSAFASFTPVAGDIAVLPGSAAKTIFVTRIEVSLSTSGTAAIDAIQLIKRSTADTAGTSAAMTAVPHDSNFAAATAAPLSYTAAPTLGTAVGTIRGVQFSDASSALPGANTWIWTFGDGRDGASPLVLRGTAQELCVNAGSVVATQTATVSFEWTEV